MKTIRKTIFAMVWSAMISAAVAAPMETSKPMDWNGLTVLDLKTAGALALLESPDLAAVRERVQQAKEQVIQARSAYFPSLTAGGSISRVDQSENYMASVQAFGLADPEDYYAAELTASWVLFNGFERKYTHAAAKYGRSQSEFALKDARRLLLSAVSATYFSAQLALEKIAIAEADAAFYGRQLEEAEVRYQLGAGSLSDQLNFEIRVNAAKAGRIAADRDFETAMVALAALMGIENSRIPDHVRLQPLEPETADELLPPDLIRLTAYAQANRPDLLLQTAALQQAEAERKLAKAPFYPSVSLSGSLAGERENDADMEQDDFGNTIALSLSYNLFAGGRYRSQVREARSKIKEVEHTLTQLNITVASDVQSSAAEVRQAQQALLLQRENARLVRQNRELVEKEYNAGQSSLVRLNEAQRDLTTAQAQLAQSLAALRQAWYDLKAETGQIEALFVGSGDEINDSD
jgi:outer membrane protein TolC